ncbi:hypothetical protein JVT61DRAFT_7272 [Boletus reticuloceps]|uniref:Uncharacterized protein n=1 Tax=Boletus reticuloceps TaxID=495285 RepID=A0A8I2YIG0_9AGAM|nr:hypothetical protein JVT61DRAFT_7272 [Boletus reticuloceps]
MLKTQDVGDIPVGNIEIPFEGLVRLTKHCSVNLAHATPQELQEDVEHIHSNFSSRTSSHSPSPILGLPAGTHCCPGIEGVMFAPALSIHHYLPAVWNEDEEEEEVKWEDGVYQEEDLELAKMSIHTRQSQFEDQESMIMDAMQMEPDDGMSWDDSAAKDMQAWSAQMKREQQMLMSPETLQPGALHLKPVQQLQQQQVVSQQQQEVIIAQQEQQMLSQQVLHHQSSRDRLSPKKTFPSYSFPCKSADLFNAGEMRKLSTTLSIIPDEPSKPLAVGTGLILPRLVIQQPEDNHKQTRKEVDEDTSKKKLKGKEKDETAPVTGSSSPAISNQPVKSSHSGIGKLRKECESTDDEGKEKEMKRDCGIFGLFGCKKDKDKDKDKDKASIENISSDITCESQDSDQSSNQCFCLPLQHL